MRKDAFLKILVLGAIGCLSWTANGQNPANPAVGPVEVSAALQHDVSPALRDIPGKARAANPTEKPLRLIPRGLTANQTDPVVQSTASVFVATTTGLNLAGVGNGDYGFVPNAAPPDTNGAVGASQYVQWVNESFAVFDKTTGALLLGPKAGNTLWTGFGGGCETNNDGDPVVQYDKVANRWVLTQFSVSTTPYLQCVAVSTTSDATGSYYRYAFSQPNFNDYPKLGVWPDGYYISFNMFNGNSFAGGRACAFDRTKMLAGNSATQQCFQLSNAYGGLLPSDLDGATLPPAASPNYFVAFGNNVLQFFKFHVDFTTPANSTFIGPANIAVAAFSPACSGGGTCIPQSGTSQQLDSLGDRVMHRFAYRNFGDHEALVVNHSVAAGSSVGVRWYELRNPNTTPTVFQQGTYAPDSNYRWMGSIAMDQAGNIALGYSVSSSLMFPAIRYTGRAPTDTLGTLQAETSIKEGGGSQSGNRLSRWGDYSAMTIDPIDDCTFFYTNEYLKSTGSFNWSTQIASFKFPGCGSTAPDVAITQLSVPSPVLVNSANSVNVTVKNVGGANAGTFSVSLTDSLGATISGSQQLSLAAGASANLTFSWTPTAAGSHTLTATATSPSGETNTANNTLTAGSTVNVASPPDFSLSMSPSSVNVKHGKSASYTVTVTPSGGFTGSVALSLAGQPSGSTYSFSPSSATTTSTLNVTTSPSGPTGTFNLTVTGTNGTLTHTATATLTVH